MKRFVLILVTVITSTTLMDAQIQWGNGSRRDRNATELNQYQSGLYVEMLNRQNRLLTNRKIASCISLGGSALYLIGMNVATMDTREKPSNTGYYLAGAGAVAAAGGGIWLLVNEFCLINSQKRINNHLIVRYSPGGIALVF
jgi:hypothetical protein